MMNISLDLLQWYKFLIKRLLLPMKTNLLVMVLKWSEESAEELHKPIIRKFGKQTVNSPLIDNTWGADLADM